MSRRFTLTAEIVGRGDKPLAKVALPDTIRHDSAQERLVRRSQPQRQSLTTLRYKENTLRLNNWRARIQGREEPGLDCFTLFLEIPMNKNVRVRHDFFVRQNIGRGI